MTAEGRSINVTLIFSLSRYRRGDRGVPGRARGRHASGGGDLADVHSVASFFVSRVDTEVDRRLDAMGTPEALALRGRAAVAQAKLAYRLFRERFGDERWAELAARRRSPATTVVGLDVDQEPGLRGHVVRRRASSAPDTVNTLPESTIAAFEDHGTVGRTIDRTSTTQARCSTGWPTSASTWRTSASPSRIKAWTPSTNRSPTFSTTLDAKARQLATP